MGKGVRQLVVAGLLGLASSGTAAWGQGWGVRPGGAPLQRLAPAQARAVVLFFVATDCPVSNRMFPEMRRLREEFRSRGVQTWFVYPNRTEVPNGVLQHQQTFDPGGEALLDPEGRLLRLSAAVATPEMAILAPAGGEWRTVYAGRIDNKFVHLGLERPVATEHDGEEAVLAVLAGRVPRPAVGRPAGCAILSPGVRP